ncbi:hypothetical protein AGOR_G00017340 [Albula goreensis]|uniref:Uncharacterized protein n=1 Tax=Albula goreensis TaxID=1534307 RepID=A0A8T3E1L9_9TELE|nr:hypothetical protein AGOR_G00017340 [Albula goreensis]
MDSQICCLLLLSVCLRHVPTVSAQKDIREETINVTSSLSTPVATIKVLESTMSPTTSTTQKQPQNDNHETLTTTMTSVFNASLTHPVSTALPTTSSSGKYSSAETSTAVPENKSQTTTPGNTRGTETTSSQMPFPQTSTSARRASPFISSTAATQSATTTAAKSSTEARASSASPTGTAGSVPPTQATGNSLTMLAFGVMTFILILIIVMVVLVTAIHLRGRCNSKVEGKKSGDSVLSESQVTSNGEKESITLVSVKTINNETDTDSPQISSVHSTTLDSEDQELRRDLLNNKLV